VHWNLLGCGRSGHVTYVPTEPELRYQLSGRTASGTAWRCLRCGSFVTGDPQRSGPAAGAPQVRRGKEIRSALILRVFAIERFLRALLFGGAAYLVWRFRSSRQSIGEAFHRELPILRDFFRQLGYNIDHSRLVGLIQHALRLSPATITILAAGLAGYAVIEVVEGVGLWLVKRWGEYFAMVATSLGLPYEIYDMTAKITVTRVLFFVINLALVLYLVITKRLFGVRGGKRAYEARLRSESIIEEAMAAAARERAAASGPTPAAEAGSAASGASTPASSTGPAGAPVG
jgi:uncharacterized membrane protein (DUF2068 family)